MTQPFVSHYNDHAILALVKGSSTENIFISVLALNKLYVLNAHPYSLVLQGNKFQSILEKHILHCNYTYFVQQVDLRVCVRNISRMFHQQCYETHECIKSVETLCSNQRWSVRRFSKDPVTQINTHLRAQAEKPCDQIISFQNPMAIHLGGRKKKNLISASRSQYINTTGSTLYVTTSVNHFQLLPLCYSCG